MAYEKLNLQDGQVLDAAALAHMEDGIENAVPPTLIVTIDMDDSDNYVASATYQEIADAITAGRYVMCAYGTQAFQLVNSPVLSDIAPMIALPAHVFFHVGDGSDTYVRLFWIEINSDNDVSFTTKKLTFDT